MESATFQIVNNTILSIVGFYFLWNFILPFVYKTYRYTLVIAAWFKGPPPKNEFSSAAYWMRLSVTIQVCLKEALLDILHDPTFGGLPRNKSNLYKVIDIFKQSNEKRLKNEIKQFQWEIMCHQCTSSCDLMCPKYCVSISENFDLTCIVLLIINLTKLPPPSGVKGWKQKEPNELDFSKAAFVLRARNMRNSMVHSSLLSVNGQDLFDEKWKELEEILIGLAYKRMDRFHGMKTASMEPYLVQQVTSLKNCYTYLEEGKCTVEDMNIIQDQLNTYQTLVADLEDKVKEKADQSDLQIAFQMLRTQRITTEKRFSFIEKNVSDLTKRVESLENERGMSFLYTIFFHFS